MTTATANATTLKLVVGLGNPGTRYTYTRHNLGFLIVDTFLVSCLRDAKGDYGKQKKLLDDKAWKAKHSGQFLELGTHDVFQLPGHAARLDVHCPYWLKPETFMNLSGDAVAACIKSINVTPPEILVIHDELDLPAGTLRLKFSGGPGGHNGLISIIDRLGTQEFWRLRVGIGKPPPSFVGAGADYVLGKMPPEEFEQTVTAGVEALHDLFKHGATRAMQMINSQ